MIVRLHKQARPPRCSYGNAAATGTRCELTALYNFRVLTIAKWRKCDSVKDRSHAAHRLQTTQLPGQKQIAVGVHKTLRLDDVLVAVRNSLHPHVSRSDLDLCLRHHGVGNLRDLEPTASNDKP